MPLHVKCIRTPVHTLSNPVLHLKERPGDAAHVPFLQRQHAGKHWRQTAFSWLTFFFIEFSIEVVKTQT